MAERPEEVNKCPKEVDIEQIIKEVMQGAVDPTDVEEEEPFDVDNFIRTIKCSNEDEWSRRYFRGRAYGQFQCDNELCGNSWSSAYAWCVLDLKEQKLKMKFKQECESAKSHKAIEQLALKDGASSVNPAPKHPGVDPCYEDEDSVRRMAQWAVDLHLYLTGKKGKKPKGNNAYYRPTPEHRDGLCEMCKRLGRLCFERK